MAEQKHTPGPWHAEHVGESDYGDVYEVYNVNTQIASSMWEADARLIAAAPELLEALRYTLQYAEKLEKAAGLSSAANVSLDKARAAIAKAEGK
jgi:hypothetical protein